MSRFTAGQKAGLAAAAGLAVGGFALLRNFDPNSGSSPFPPCMFYTFTGFYCPACGGTRAMHALAHFDVPGAMAMNPLLVLSLPVLALLGAWWLGWKPKWLQPVVAALSKPGFWLALLPAYWVLRNLPWFPFTLLAPG